MDEDPPDQLIYLDHQATTPLDPQVLDAMLPWLRSSFWNAASQHLGGLTAARVVSDAREQVASLIGGRASGVVFTSGATEANNLALKGVVDPQGIRRQIVTVATEHPSVLETAEHRRRSGYDVDVLGVDVEGSVDLAELERVVTPRTLLVSVMAANNEIGTIAPVGAIAEIAHAAGALFHCDATQAVGKVAVSARDDEIDLLSLSAHKLYGPKGVGALHVSRTARPWLEAVQHGGGHESGLRSGTLNVPGIVGLGHAAAIASSLLDNDAAHCRMLADRLHVALAERLDGLTLNGPSKDRLPGNLNICIDGTEGDDLMLRMPGLAVSTGSACSSASPAPSPVLLAIGRSYDQALSALRFGTGRFTSESEVDAAAEMVISAVEAARVEALVRSSREGR